MFPTVITFLDFISFTTSALTDNLSAKEQAQETSDMWNLQRSGYSACLPFIPVSSLSTFVTTFQGETVPKVRSFCKYWPSNDSKYILYSERIMFYKKARK